MELSEQLQLALQRDELKVFYQPVVQLRRGSMVGLEALIRWQHPERGLLMPADFVDEAERAGLLVQVGERVLLRACATLRRWQDMGLLPRDVTVAVNVAAQQWDTHALIDTVREVLLKTALPAHNLRLEITESAALRDQEHVVKVLHELNALGVRSCIDDFGTGYASLDYLRAFPVSTLKLDRTFVRGLGQDRRSDEIVAAVVRLAHDLGIDVVAEGIESHEQVQHLLRLDCDFGQGFLYAAPIPERDMAAYVSGFSETTEAAFRVRKERDETMEHRLGVVKRAPIASDAPRLVVTQGPATGRVVYLDRPEVLIGRSPDATLSIGDELLSRHHARVFFDPNNDLHLLDLGSRNGTLCNGQLVTKCPLRDGDKIMLGRTVIDVELQKK